MRKPPGTLSGYRSLSIGKNNTVPGSRKGCFTIIPAGCTALSFDDILLQGAMTRSRVGTAYGKQGKKLIFKRPGDSGRYSDLLETALMMHL